ncbi:MAG: dihydroxy-acid dehydratase, partial [Planctomycetaceae bacterium]
VQDGDQISFDLLNGTIHLHVSDEGLQQRRAGSSIAPKHTPNRGYLADWSATTAQASHGCVSVALYPECRSEVR